jgi:two-component system aerobic respiration control sensor histidine kinase ArcB
MIKMLKLQANCLHQQKSGEFQMKGPKNDKGNVVSFFSEKFPVESIFANAPDYVFCKDTESRYIFCNQNFANLLSLENRLDVIGKTDYDFLFEEHLADQFILDDKHVIHSGKPITNEYELKFKKVDGHRLFIRIDKTPILDSNNTVIGVFGIAIDVTDQKRALSETHIAHTFLEDILFNLPGHIYWKNKNSQYLGFNANVVHLSGLPREELLGKTDAELNWGREEAEKFKQDDIEVMEKGIVKITEHEIPLKRPDGHNMILRTEKSRLYDREGLVVGVLGVAIDITDQKILEAKLIEEKQKVEILSAAKTEFIHDMEHDIRTPFSGVYSLVQIMEGKETDKGKKDILTAILKCSKELLDYCNGILDFSVSESKSRPIISKKFDLKQLINKVVDIEKPPALDKSLELLIDYPDNIPLIFLGDEYRILRILVNLVGNAIKFTNKGYVKISVNIAKQIDDRNLILKIFVKDSGIGIPEDQINYIFEKFSRLTPANHGTYKGSGLGLSIVKTLINELEGEVDVVSSPDVGSTFICILPMKLPLINDIISTKE